MGGCRLVLLRGRWTGGRSWQAVVACTAPGQSYAAFLSVAGQGRAGYWPTRSGTCPDGRRRALAGSSGALMRSTCRARCPTRWPILVPRGGSAGGRLDGPRSCRIGQTAEAADSRSTRGSGNQAVAVVTGREQRQVSNDPIADQVQARVALPMLICARPWPPPSAQ
jgi:hypothetical protein